MEILTRAKEVLKEFISAAERASSSVATKNASGVPWFDRPDALRILEQRRRTEHLSDRDFELLRKWVVDGYFIIPGCVSHELIDAMERDLDALWRAPSPTEGLEVLDLRLSDSAAPRNVPHAEILQLSAEEKAAARERSAWRMHGFYQFSEAARAVYEHPELRRLASLVLGEPTGPSFSINFSYGSRQAAHQDTSVFHVSPMNYLVGTWLACEDISPDAGPLFYCPRSHKEPLFKGFDNYPHTNLRTTRDMKAYNDYALDLSKKFERHHFLAKKGDVFFWHGMLIHGGSDVKNPKITRRSHAVHFIPPGKDVSGQVKGPFNW